MYLPWQKLLALTSILALNVFAETNDEKKPRVLWQEPDISSRDLFYGPGGKENIPAEPFIFVKEDLSATSPKFVVTDSKDRKWKVKLGGEARPETTASRFVWALGYAADQNYFLPSVQISNMPQRLERGAKHVSPDGTVRDARWESMEREKIGLWHWRTNPFDDTRELNGLRVMMSLLNNFDLKDSQNSIYETPDGYSYAVTDLGATFGRSFARWPGPSILSNPDWYAGSRFIRKVTNSHVDFEAPGWPKVFGFAPVPPFPFTKEAIPFHGSTRKWVPNITYQRWIGKGVPIEHVRWMAGLLGQLSPKQIRDAFRAAHYSDAEVEQFSRVVETRIADLKQI